MMIKSKLSLATFVLLSTSTVFASGNQAVEIDIGGIGPAVDAAAVQTVLQVVGHSVASGVVDKFEIKGYGIEGGFSACAQASPITKTFGSLVKQLRTIKPNPKTTAYSVRTVASCADDLPVCTQEVKLCPDGKTYVGRTGPRCEFAPCPGE